MMILLVVLLCDVFGAIRTVMPYDGCVIAPVEDVAHHSLVFVPVVARRQEEVQGRVIA